MTCNIGSVSHGTMRNEDLISTFLDWLNSEKLTRDSRNSVRGIQSRYNTACKFDKDVDREENPSCQESPYWDEEAGYDCEELFDIMNEIAPPYFYFGASEGDGSDYGFWLCENFNEEFDGLKVTEQYAPEQIVRCGQGKNGYTGEVLHTTDHGNMTLYSCNRGKLREIWSLV